MHFPKLTLQQKLFLALGVISLLSVIYLSSQSGVSPLSPPATTTAPLPPKTNPPQNPQLEKFQISGITLPSDFSLPSLPETLPVYRVSPTSPDYIALASNLARYFQLPLSDYSKNTWQSKDGTRSVKINYQNLTISYQYSPLPSSAPAQQKSPVSLESATEFTSSFIKSFPEWKDYSVQGDQIAYLQSGSGEYVPTTPENADIIRIPLIGQLDGYLLRPTNQNSAPLTLYIGPGNTLYKLVFIPDSFSVNSDPESKPVTSSENILSYLRVGQVQILDAFRESFIQNLDRPAQITVQSVSVEYHLLPKEQIVAPYYLFRGIFRQSAISSVDQPVLFILPVVDL